MANSCDWRAETINDLLNRACDDALEVIFGNGLFGDESDVLAALIGVFCGRAQRYGSNPGEALELMWPDIPAPWDDSKPLCDD